MSSAVSAASLKVLAAAKLCREPELLIAEMVFVTYWDNSIGILLSVVFHTVYVIREYLGDIFFINKNQFVSHLSGY